MLLATVLAKNAAWLIAHASESPGNQAEHRFADLVERRVRGEPVAYILGEREFYGLRLQVTPAVLIPRPETEYLWEQAVAALDDAGPGTRIVDLCTGSGALALALKARFPAARVIGTDVSEEALALATENAALNTVDVEWCKGDLFEALPTRVKGRIDLIVSNPPYVSAGEYTTLPEEIRRYEPKQALVAGTRATKCSNGSQKRSTGGWAPVGGCSVRSVSRRPTGHWSCSARWLYCEVRNDLAGRPRVLVGRKGARCC